MPQVPLSPLEKVLSSQPSASSRGIFKPEAAAGSGDSKALSSKKAVVPDEYLPAFKSSAEKYNVPANVLMGMAEQESTFNPRAVGAQTQWGTAKGLMGYLDATAKNLGFNAYDAPASIDAAARQIRERLDKGYSLDDAVREHFAGPDRKKWGKKTEAYSGEVFDKSAKYENAFGATQQLGATDVANAPELAPAGGYTAEQAQAALEEMNAAEPGRYQIATAEEIAAAEAGGDANAMLPEAEADAGFTGKGGKPSRTGAAGSDGFLEATGKAVQNIPGNFKEAGAGLIRSIGEGVDDQTLVTGAADAGIVKALQERGVISMKPSKTGFSGQDVPTLPNGKEATVSELAAFLRQNPGELLRDDDGTFNGLKQSALTEFGAKMGKEARKNRLEVNPDGPLAKYGSMIISSTAEMLPALIAGAVTKSPMLTVGMIGGQVKGQSYETGREGGLNPDEAAAYATAHAMAEAIPSILPVHAILAAPTGSFFKGIFKAGAAESVQEGITAAIQSGIDKGTIKPDMTWEEARQQIIDGMIVGAGSGSMLRAGMDGTARVREGMKSDAQRFGEELERSVDQTNLVDDSESVARAAFDPNNGQPQADPQTGEVMPGPAPLDAAAAPPEPLPAEPEVAPAPAAPAPAGPLARAAAAAPVVQEAAPPAPTESALDSVIRPDGGADAFAGTPGTVVSINLPGLEPFQATVEGYVDGDVMMRDAGGDRFQITREEMLEAGAVQEGRPSIETGIEETNKVADALAEVEQQLAELEATPAPKAEPAPEPKPEPAPAPAPKPEPAPAPKVEPEQKPAAKKSLDEMDVAELRGELRYLGTQAKNSGGWNRPLMAERKKVEAAIGKATKAEAHKEATKAAETVTEQPKKVTKPTETVTKPDEKVTSENKPEPAFITEDRLKYAEKEKSRLKEAPEPKIVEEVEQLNQFLRDAEFGSHDSGRTGSIEEIKARAMRELESRGYSAEKLAKMDKQLPNIPLPNAGDKVAFGRSPATVIEASERGVKVRQRGKEITLTVSQYQANQLRGAEKKAASDDVKWFGSQEKADAFIAKKKMADTHEVVSKDGRFEIKPKAKAAPVNKPPAEYSKYVPVPSTKSAQRTRDAVGDIGDTVTFSRDVGYAKAGKPYTITNIDEAGTAHVSTPGGKTTLNESDIAAAIGQGMEATKLPVMSRQKSSRPDGSMLTRRELAEALTESLDTQRATGSKEGIAITERIAKEHGIELPAAKPAKKARGQVETKAKTTESEWQAFDEASGTKGIPRSEMPQVKAEDRGAMVNFLKARGIDSKSEAVKASTLKPTQAEFSPAKVQAAKDREGGNRSIIVSADGHVVDGHHQWLAALEENQNVGVIRLDAPIGEVLAAIHGMPSATVSTESDSVASGQPESKAKTAKPVVSENKIFTEDAAAEARKVILASLGTARSGIDPKLAVAGLTLAGYHIEKGARSFSAYAKAMTADLGDIVRPYLKSWYMAAKYDPRMADMEGLSSPTEVDVFDTSKPIQLDETNAPDSTSRVEPNSSERAATEPVVSTPAVDAPGADAVGAGKPSRSADAAESAGRRDSRVSTDGAAAGRKRGDNVVHQQDGLFEPSGRPARDTERDGSGASRSVRTPTERKRAKQIARNATAVRADELGKRLAAQKAATNVPTKFGDKASIDEALPLLLPAQREDVLKAEIRFANANGMLYTNGTGTGKTATGLGFAKRMINAGKPNGIIIVPTDKIASDWVAFGKMMGMDIKQLDGLADNGGQGQAVTTYANFGNNKSLAQREFDWLIPDESHYLSSNADGETTAALNQLRALTGHPLGFETFLRNKHAKAYERLNDTYNELIRSETNESYTADDIAKAKRNHAAASKDWAAIREAARPKWDARWRAQENIPKVNFLSATPFAYAKSTDYAEGFLFHYVEPADYGKKDDMGLSYNTGNAREKFMMENFGYRMRYNKLTQPEAGVDSQIMEQQFNAKLKREGALSGRRLDVPHDYDRKFVSVDDAVGKRIDEAMRFLREGDDGAHRKVFDAVNSSFDHQSRMYLLEALKARAVVDMIKADMAAGRKVVVFHDYNKGGAENPFRNVLRTITNQGLRDQARQVLSKPMFHFNMEGLQSPIETLLAAFPEAMFFNGTVGKAKRRKNADTFNDDATGPQLLVAQSDAAREGVSLHDTTGKHPRVMYNLGLPTKPVAATQIEGRTYRTGQASDAMFRYLTTGTGWETSAFASRIAERASTAENLALGEEARNLKTAFIDAYNEAEPFSIGPNDGKGGKAKDSGTVGTLSDFERSKSFYWANQKNTKRRGDREGTDYFATAEPVGLKKVQWADIKPGDRVLEPSAGHGAIARFFPPQTDVTMIEPSYDLAQRAGLANGTAKVINDNFESLHVSNKFDAIVMNPPFGVGGKTAVEHLAKAARHIAEGGRIVATIPRGGLADRRLDAFFADPAHANLHTVADIEMPGVAFERSGTAVNTRVLVLERHSGEDVNIQPQKISLDDVKTTKELFDRIENLDLPERQGNKSSLLDGSGRNGNSYDVAGLDSALRTGELGGVLGKMIDSGSLKLHDSAPAGIHSLTQGWTDANGVIHLVAGQLNSDTAIPVVLHEAFHAGGETIMQSKRWTALMGRLNGYYKAAEAGTIKGAWADAYRRVDSAIKAGDSMSRLRAIEELGAYSIENYESAPKGIKQWVDGFIGMVKDFLARKFGIQVGAVTPAQLRSLAVAVLRESRAGGRNTAAMSMGETRTATELAAMLRAEYPGLKLDLMGKNGRATLSRVVVPDGERNTGIGTEIMQRIVEWADSTGTTVALSPTADFGGNKARLTGFYKRHGFIENKGKNRDFEVSESMYRLPQDAVKSSIADGTVSGKEVDGWFTRQMTDAMAGPKSKGQYSFLALAPMDRMIEELSGDNLHAKEYLNLKRDMDAYRAKKHADYDTTAQKWLNINIKHPKAGKDMARLMHDATIEQIDPAEPFKERMTERDHEILAQQPNTELGFAMANKMAEDKKRMVAYEELRKRFAALPAELQTHYRKVRDTYKDMTEELDQILMQNLADAIDATARKAERVYESEMLDIKDEGLTGTEKADAEAAALKKYNTATTKQRMSKKARMTLLRQQFESNRLEGPYFPLARFGDLFVTVRDKDSGEVISFNRFEDSTDQQKFAASVQDKGKVTTGLLKSSDEIKGAVDPRFVADIEEILSGATVPDAVKDQVWQRYIESMPEMSLRKGFIHRKNREGYTQDATRAFANRMFHGSHQLGRLKFGGKMQEAIEMAGDFARKTATPERDTAVANEIARRHDYVMNPKGGAFAQKLTSAAFIYQLSMSPAAALVNMSQTVMIGVPVIGAQFGAAKTMAELGKAAAAFTTGMGRAGNSKMLNAEEKAAMKAAYDSGLIESSQSHSLAGVGDGIGVQYSAVRTRVMGVMAWMFHQTERVNREVTFLTAYRLAKQAGQSQDQAIKTGTDLTYKTHFDYANTNRPRAMHGDTAKVALVFRNYQINMLWRLFRDTHQVFNAKGPERTEAIKQLGGITGMMALHAGVKGTWLYGIGMILASMIFGDDAEDEFKKATVEALGPTAGGMLLNGIPGHLTGTALSSRVGMPDLWFRSPDRQLEGKDEFQYWQAQLLGFLPTIPQNMVMGVSQAKEGNYYRGLETAGPKFIKDIMRAARFANEGATNMRGETLVERLTPGEVAAQAMGFTPAVVAEQYERNSSLKNAEKVILDKRRGLMDKFAIAYKLGDMEGRKEITGQIKEFNKEHRTIAITPATLQQSIKARKTRSDRTDGGIYINPKLDKQLRDNLGPAIYR